MEIHLIGHHLKMTLIIIILNFHFPIQVFCYFLVNELNSQMNHFSINLVSITLDHDFPNIIYLFHLVISK